MCLSYSSTYCAAMTYAVPEFLMFHIFVIKGDDA